MYIPPIRTSEPAYTPGGEFVVLSTGRDYKGDYIEDFRGRFFAGKTIEENGEELEQVEKVKESNKLTKNFLKGLPLLLGFFKPKLKKGDREKGQTSRYILQNKNTKQISEVDKESFFDLQDTLTGYTAVEVPWIIKGPAEDKIINGYPFEGAASKNKKAIQDLESQIPGISLFITNYSELVEEPTPIPTNQAKESQQSEPQSLEDFRKANFDKRK